MTTRISALSKEFYRTQVKTDPGVDPTGDTVAFTFTTTKADPVNPTWTAGSWTTVGGKHLAQVLIGPGGGLVLAKGKWFVWVKITASPEVPVKLAPDPLVIF